MLVGNSSFFIDHKRLRYAVDSPFEADAPIDIGTGARIGIAQLTHPIGGVFRLVLIIKSVNRYHALLLE